MNKCLFFLYLYIISCTLNAQENSKKNYLDTGSYYFELSGKHIHNYDSCIYYTQLAQTYFEKAEAWNDYVDCFNGLSTVYFWKGDFEQYKRFADEALKAAENYLNPESRPYAYAINNMGVYYKRKGDYDKALELYKKSLAIQKKSDPTSKYIARTYKNIGRIYEYKQDYLEALKYYNKSISFRQLSGHDKSSSYANDLLILGKTYETLNQRDSALNLYNKSIAVLQRIPKNNQHLSTQTLVLAQQGIAKIFLAQKKYTTARNYIKRALKDDYDQHVSYELLAQYYLANNQQNRALEALNKAYRILKKKDTKKRASKSLAQLNQKVAELYSKSGEDQQSLVAIQAALQQLTIDFSEKDSAKNPSLNQIIYKPEALAILQYKAETLTKLYEQTKAEPYLQQAFQCYQLAKQLLVQIRQDFLATGSKYLLSEKAVKIYDGAIHNAKTLFTLKKSQAYLADIFHSMESNKSLTLLQSLQDRISKKSAGVPDSLLAKEYDLNIDMAFYKKTIYLEKQKGSLADIEKIKKWENMIFDLEEENQALKKEMERLYPSYFQLKYQDHLIDINALQNQLSNQTNLIEYFVGENKIYIMSIDRNNADVVSIKIDHSLTTAIDGIRKILSQSPNSKTAEKDFSSYTQQAYYLYQQLVAPAIKDKDQINRLIIIPESSLSFIPFEALLTQDHTTEKINYTTKQLTYLLEKYIISYDYSASLWLTNNIKKQNVNEQNFIGFAPIFENQNTSDNRTCTGDELANLRCSYDEVKAIQQILNGVIITNTDATKTSFLEEAKKYKVIHLATHACIDEQNPMLNTIHFTDDYISNYDLSTLSLNADLAVLSACNTGAGKHYKGEGVMSLARNFTQAGCQSILMSLWPVNDCATADIMTQFYSNLVDGQTKDEALRNSKLTFLKTAYKLERNPYYWAAFIQLGNPKVLSFEARKKFGLNKVFLLLTITGILFLLGYYFLKKS